MVIEKIKTDTCKSRLYLLLYLFFLCTSTSSLFAQYHFVNTPTGAVNALLSRNDTLYAATETNKVFFSANGGSNWTKLGSASFGTNGPTALAFTPNNHLIAVTNQGGVKDWDGTTWTTINNGLPFSFGQYPGFTSVASDASGNLFAGCRTIPPAVAAPGMYYYNGTVWTTANNGLGNLEINALIRAASGRIYAGTDAGVYYYNTVSAAWLLSSNGLPGGAVYCFLNDPFGTLLAGTAGGIYKFNTVNSTWQSAGAGLPVKPVLSLAADPSFILPVKMYAGLGYTRDLRGALFGEIYMSDNFAASWSSLTGTLKTGAIKGITVLSTGYVYAGGLGVYRAEGGTANWSAANNGLNFGIAMNRSGYIAVNPLNNHFFLGTDNGIFRSVDDGLQWAPVFTGLGHPYVTALRINPANGHIYAGMRATYLNSNQLSAVYRSMDDGNTWDSLPVPPDNWYTDFAFYNNKVYCTHGFGAKPPTPITGSIVSQSADYGNTWQDLNLNGAVMGAGFSCAVNSSGHLFVAGELAGISRSTDGGNTFTTVATPTIPGNLGPVRVNSFGDIIAGNQSQYPVHYSAAASNGSAYINMTDINWPQYRSLNAVLFDNTGKAFLGLTPAFGAPGLYYVSAPYTAASVFNTLNNYPVSSAVKSMDWDICGHLLVASPGGVIMSDTILNIPLPPCGLVAEHTILFSGYRQSGSSYLEWTIKGITDISGFVLERSADGIHFSRVDSVDACAGCTDAHLYRYTDKAEHSAGNFYYRLFVRRQYMPGIFSEIIRLQDGNESTLQLMPNPVRSISAIQLVSQQETSASADLYDMAGRKLATRKLILRKGINSGVFSTTTAISATGIFRVIVKTGERSYAFNVLVQ
jgi:photosystem II stability/assembly factor-like uncharacterized protein